MPHSNLPRGPEPGGVYSTYSMFCADIPTIQRRCGSVTNEWWMGNAVVARDVGQYVTQSFAHDFGIVVRLQGKPTLSVYAEEST